MHWTVFSRAWKLWASKDDQRLIDQTSAVLETLKMMSQYSKPFFNLSNNTHEVHLPEGRWLGDARPKKDRETATSSLCSLGRSGWGGLWHRRSWFPILAFACPAGRTIGYGLEGQCWPYDQVNRHSVASGIWAWLQTTLVGKGSAK